MMEANVYENEFKVKEINSHLRSWENVKEIIKGNFLGAFLDSNYLDLKFAFGIFNNVYRVNLKDGVFDANNLKQVISVVQPLPTFNMFLLHRNIKFSDLISECSKIVIHERKLVEELSSYFTFHINFCLENGQNLYVLYENCFNLQGNTDFLINFLKATTLNEDFSRTQEYADNETKRVITVSQLAVFHKHSWLNSSVPPDKETCEFCSRFDSLLTKEQSDKFSYTNNADVDKLTKKEKGIREQFSSSNFRNMVNEYQKSTFQELKNYVEIKNDEIIIKCYPDKNRFQMIMYSPDKNLSLQERYIKYAFFQKAAEKGSKWIQEFINSLEEPKQIEMPEELQNMMKIIDEASFNYKIEDDVIYDNFLNKFFEKFVSKDQILQDILNGNYIGNTQVLKNITEILFRNCTEEKKKEIILKLLSSESKLRVDFKSKLLFENLELLKDKDNQIVKIFPNDDFLSELYSGNLNNIYYVTIVEVIFFKFPIEENDNKIMNLLSLESKLSYEAKKCLLHNLKKKKI